MQQSSSEIIALTVVFSVLAIISCALRWWARYVKDLEIKTDDILIFVSLFLFITGVSIPILILCVHANLGNHIQLEPNGEPLPPSYLFKVCQLVLEVVGYAPIALTKCSICFFYKRLFRGPIFSVVNWATIGLCVAWMFAFCLAIVFNCVPVGLSLTEPTNPAVHCINQLDLFYAGAASDVIIDILVLAIPMPIVWKLNMATHLKVGLIGVFLLGGLTFAASIARLVVFTQAGAQQNSGSDDYTYYLGPPIYWTALESALVIIGACLPTLRPLVFDTSPRAMKRGPRGKLSFSFIHGSGSQREQLSSRKHKHEFDDSSFVRLNTDGPCSTSDTKTTAYAIPMRDLPEAPLNGIMVQKSWARTDSTMV
ncbi:hypothetical protein MMC26_003274 [Xylographa opegraphella]|nr:hypothetical protein [Xylographa opegraphella]